MNLICLYRKISIEYIIEMNKILDVVEDIKPNITENQYNEIMEGLNEIFPLLSENRQLNRLIRFFN